MIDPLLEAWAEFERADAERRGAYGDAEDAEWAVSFDHHGRVKTFYRSGESRGAAVESAQHGFQWRYGYWPGDPVRIERA